MIAIIDYNMGNLASVKNALDSLGYESVITSDKDVIMASDKAILPGVGAFKDAMEELKKRGLVQIIKEYAETKKPLLGICLGMQLMFESSDEYGFTEGLSLLKGKIVRFNNIPYKIPHMGWNNLIINPKSKLMKGLNNDYVYFVHSYHLDLESDIVAAYCDYGIRFGAAIEYNNLYATQFHPEKSGEIGLKILRNFGEL